MEALTTHNVNDLPQGERDAIEHLLGQPLSSDQTVFIMALTAGKSADPATRDAARQRLEERFDAQAQHAHQNGITGEEADDAVAEAMRQIRPRPE